MGPFTATAATVSSQDDAGASRPERKTSRPASLCLLPGTPDDADKKLKCPRCHVEISLLSQRTFLENPSCGERAAASMACCGTLVAALLLIGGEHGGAADRCPGYLTWGAHLSSPMTRMEPPPQGSQLPTLQGRRLWPA